MAEHAIRLSNWSEIGSQSVYGQAYSDNALINTGTTEGGFDYIGLGWVNQIEAARQITDESDAHSGAIVESICRQFFLCNYKNTSGQECINSILATEATPEVSLTLASVIPGSISAFEEVPAQDIFCEPIVRYAENYATDKFDGVIQITNAHKDTFSASYVSGLEGTDANDAWDLCHALYLRYKIVTAAPDELTDHKWIRRKTDAVAYLWAWLEHMGAYFDEDNAAVVGNKRRFSFQVPYSTAMTIGSTHAPWYISMKFNMNLPHGTDTSTVQCMIEKISFNVTDFTATITAICYDMDEAVAYNVQDSWDSYSAIGLDDWQDIVTTKAEVGTQGNDIQKTM